MAKEESVKPAPAQAWKESVACLAKLAPEAQGKGHACEDSPLENGCSGHPGGSVLGPDQAAKLGGRCFIKKAQ